MCREASWRNLIPWFLLFGSKIGEKAPKTAHFTFFGLFGRPYIGPELTIGLFGVGPILQKW